MAIPVAGELRAALAREVEGWKADPRLVDWRWTDAASWHVTLAFLGAVDPTGVGAIPEAVGRVVARVEPLCVEADRAGAFPSPGRARVLWCGLRDPSDRVVGLMTAVRDALGVVSGETVQPHVTLARGPRRPSDVRAFLRSVKPPAGSMTVDHVEVLRSHLGGGPARYETLASIELGGPADG